MGNRLFEMERFSEDAFRVKRIYIDITEDLTAGILLGQIVYWYLPDKKGKTKLRVFKENELWLAKGRADWWDEIRIKPRQFDRAIDILKKLDLVETKLFKFDGMPTIHIKLDVEKVTEYVNRLLRNGEKGLTDSGIAFNESVKSLTENTTKNTTENEEEESVPEIPKYQKPKLENTKNVFVFYEQNFGRLGTFMIEELGMRVDDFGGNDEIVILALQEALTSGAPYKYASTIMDNWFDKKVRTLSEAQAELVEFKRKKEIRGSGKSKKVDMDELTRRLREEEDDEEK